MNYSILPLLLILLGAILTTIGQLLFKKAALGQLTSVIKAIFSIWVMLGCALHLVGFYLYYIALSKGELSTLYPATAISYPLVVILGVGTFKETFGKEKIFALLLIIAGVVLITI